MRRKGTAAFAHIRTRSIVRVLRLRAFFLRSAVAAATRAGEGGERRGGVFALNYAPIREAGECSAGIKYGPRRQSDDGDNEAAIVYTRCCTTARARTHTHAPFRRTPFVEREPRANNTDIWMMVSRWQSVHAPSNMFYILSRYLRVAYSRRRTSIAGTVRSGSQLRGLLGGGVRGAKGEGCQLGRGMPRSTAA
jgi:hypothetical protein